VHAWHDLLLNPTMAPLLDWDAVEADEREVLAKRLAGWSEMYPDVSVRRLVVRDRPARAQVDGAVASSPVCYWFGRPGPFCLTLTARSCWCPARGGTVRGDGPVMYPYGVGGWGWPLMTITMVPFWLLVIDAAVAGIRYLLATDPRAWFGPASRRPAEEVLTEALSAL
jgi:hypothetical protein